MALEFTRLVLILSMRSFSRFTIFFLKIFYNSFFSFNYRSRFALRQIGNIIFSKLFFLYIYYPLFRIRDTKSNKPPNDNRQQSLALTGTGNSSGSSSERKCGTFVNFATFLNTIRLQRFIGSSHSRRRRRIQKNDCTIVEKRQQQ